VTRRLAHTYKKKEPEIDVILIPATCPLLVKHPLDSLYESSLKEESDKLLSLNDTCEEKKKRRVFLSEVCLSAKEVCPLWLLTNTKLFSRRLFM
jgi:hypothetical protein